MNSFWKLILGLLAVIVILSIFTKATDEEKEVMKKTEQKVNLLQEIEDYIERGNLLFAQNILDTLDVSDSIRSVYLEKIEFEKERIKEVREAVEKAKKRLSGLRSKKDEFNNVTWYRDRSSTTYTNRSDIFLYFGIENGAKLLPLRFRIQYYGDDWLFMQGVTFLIDGETFDYNPGSWERDNDAKIWEWNDSAINPNSMKIIEKLINSKSAKIRFKGRKYYDDKVITSRQIDAVKNVFEIYQSLEKGMPK